MPQHQPSYNRQGPNGGVNQQAAGGRWDAILAERQNSSNSNSGNNPYQRTAGGVSGIYNNRNTRDNNGGYGRREHEPHKPFHSHVGGQSGDAPGADWSTPLPANANLER
jgi:hypothetical protein